MICMNWRVSENATWVHHGQLSRTFEHSRQANWNCRLSEHGHHLLLCWTEPLRNNLNGDMIIREFPESHATLNEFIHVWVQDKEDNTSLFLLTSIYSGLMGIMDMHYGCVHCPAVDNIVAISVVYFFGNSTCTFLYIYASYMPLRWSTSSISPHI